MIMLTFASTSSDLHFSMPSSQFEYVKPVFCNSNKSMFFSTDVSTSSDSDFADDSGFFDDVEPTHNISAIGHEIGTKLAALCDDFDAQMMSYSRRRPASRSLLDRVLDFFAF